MVFELILFVVNVNMSVSVSVLFGSIGFNIGKYFIGLFLSVYLFCICLCLYIIVGGIILNMIKILKVFVLLSVVRKMFGYASAKITGGTSVKVYGRGS